MRLLHAFVVLIVSTIIVSSIIIVAPHTNAADEPNVFISASDIAAIKSQVQANNEPWKSSYNRVLSDANAALDKGPYHVAKNGGPNGGRDYRTELPYCGWKRVDGKDPDCRDGQINPQADRRDYEEAINFGAAVRDLGLAYAFTNDERYAQRAAYLIRVWAIDSDTRMSPKYTDNQSRIELSITMPGAFYGADLIRGSSSWPQNEQDAFEDWVDDFLGTSRWTASNNFEIWRLVTIASGGAFLNDQSELNYAFDRYKQVLPSHIGEQGQMTQELGRTKSLTYSLYSLNALTQIAEIASHNGVNLYDYTSGGRGLKTALDYHAPFSIDQSSWSRQQISPIESRDISHYEMAYNHFGEGRYLQVLQEWGRPLFERRTMGWVTLTHARLEGGPSEPSPTPPAPTEPPAPTPPPSSDVEITDLTGVSNDTTIQGNLTSEAQVSGSGVERVDFTLSGPDGYVYEKTEKHAPYSLAGDENNGQTLKSLDTTTMPNGEYTLTATAFSSNGNDERVEQFVVQNGNDGGGGGDDRISVPGKFEVEDYVDYYDKSPGNNGDSSYRNDDVDLRNCTGNEDGICAGWWDYGEYLSYDVQIAAAGDYTMVVRGATARDDVQLAVLVDGNEVSRISLANTGDTGV
ncbi:MAG: alginate lyase family protein, partial [Chloroflexota bacterium]